MKLKLGRGSTGRIARLFVQDSSSLTGAGLAGLTAASSGLAAYYMREGDASATAITLVAGTVGTYSSGGFVAADATHLPGVYELGLPNAALASGQSVLVYLGGATNMLPTVLEIELDALNYQDAVRAGLGALPNQAAGAAGGLATATNSSGQVTIAGYASGQDPPTLLLAVPQNRLLTNASGQVQHDLTQAVPTSNTAQTVGDALNAARAGAFGKWTLSGTTLTLFAPDGTTAVRVFTLDSAVAPTQRT